ncbi:hypothetical protein HOLleu_17949 [Holothuria leucospilota]|uniref:Uncharacterized protein n=1 Tax=Holothuria leucospilota TaxID=206669 RepID=A0A9Q1C2E5_HOLLE|nr:hypothetical protein HOLleu_17949 [Holothuria leucospilota]
MSNDKLNWKDAPCHFTWGMDRTVQKVHESSSVFQGENAELYSDDEESCYMFVYLAYLEFLVCRNVDQKFDGSLDKADKIIGKMRDESGKRAFQLVSLANRAWILSMSGESPEAIASVTSQLLKVYGDYLSDNNKKETAYLNAIEAFALRRILLNEKSEEKYQFAIRVIPDIAMWYYELERVAGSSPMMNSSQKTRAKIKHFKKALQFKPDYIRCMVKLIDCYLRVGNVRDARVELNHLEQYDTSGIATAICVRASFYNTVNDNDKALRILFKAEKLNHSDIDKNIAITYILKSKSVSPLKRNKYLKDALTYVEKCLLKHPGSYYGIATKFEVLCLLKESTDIVENFLRKLIVDRPLPPSHLLSLFLKMMKIFEEANKFNPHPDHEIVLTLYENMVQVALQGCLKNDDNGEMILSATVKVILNEAKTFVDRYLKKNRNVLNERNERFLELNERLLPYLNNDAI